MKTLLKKILVVVLVLGGYTSYAIETIEVESKYNKKEHPISITNIKGKIIYSGLISYDENITTLLKGTNLKDGVYSIEVNKDFEIEMKTISVKNGEIIFLEDFEEKIFKPVIRFENSKILISKLALGSDEMTVEFYYEGELIFTEKIKGEEVISRIYKLDASLLGNYKTIIKSNDRVYIENFRI